MAIDHRLKTCYISGQTAHGRMRYMTDIGWSSQFSDRVQRYTPADGSAEVARLNREERSHGLRREIYSIRYHDINPAPDP